MRCRYVNKIFLSEENGFTVAVYSTSDESVPLSARNKYLESRNTIGFTAVGYNLPLTDTIELEMSSAPGIPDSARNIPQSPLTSVRKSPG